MPGVTLKDVALRAGVSIRTVSNVVNGYEPVSPVRRARVMAAVEELDYRPNILARNLRTGRTGLLALVIPEIDVPYFSELARAMIEEADARRYRVMIDQTDGNDARERDHITGATRALLFDGVIFNPLVMPQDELRDIAGSVPVVLLGEHIFDGRFDHVAIDNVQAARDATEHLISIGRKRIAAIGSQPGDAGGTAQLRTSGYLDALAAHGIRVDRTLMMPTAKFHRADGAAAMAELLARPDPPDAVFCFSDLLALGAMKAALDAGLDVPDDLAIVGVDDIEDGRFATPGLSTISPDKAMIAAEAIRRLVERIEDPTLPVEEIVAGHQLIVRGSSVRRA